MAWRAGGRSISAGQIDALFTDKAGQYYLFDFKRVKSKHELDPDELGFKGATGFGPMADLPDTHFQKCAAMLQLCYATAMLLSHFHRLLLLQVLASDFHIQSHDGADAWNRCGRPHVHPQGSR